MRRRRVGILGGTFDPVHVGHLHIAQCARHDLHLDRVVLMPAGTPPHKPGRPLTPAEVRMEMVDAAIQDVEGLTSSVLDIGCSEPSFTSELLEAFHASEPNTDVWFIIGSDSLYEFSTWHEPGRILDLARLAVAERPGWPVAGLFQNPDLSELASRVDTFSSVPIDLSSTTIRTRIGDGRPVNSLVPPTVLAVIERHHLYRAPASR